MYACSISNQLSIQRIKYCEAYRHIQLVLSMIRKAFPSTACRDCIGVKYVHPGLCLDEFFLSFRRSASNARSDLFVLGGLVFFMFTCVANRASYLITTVGFHNSEAVGGKEKGLSS